MFRWLLPALLSLSLLVAAPSVHAAGTTATRAGDVNVINQNGVLYLSTTTNGNDASSTRMTGSRLSLSPTGIDLPTGFATDLGSLLNAILSFVMVIAALLVFLYLIWGAFDWITSGGDKAKTDKARQKIVSAVIGLIIVAASYAVLNLVVRFLGFSDFNDVLQNVRTIDGRGGTSLPPTPSPSASASATPSSTP